MKKYPWHFVAAACLLVPISASAGWSQELELPVPAPEAETAVVDDADVDVLTRGPVHEAFAEEVNVEPEPGVVIPDQPPEAIDEIPPDMKPEGDDVVWIPGYWFWDDERNKHIWISGIWRRIPPNQRWVPGYWQEVAGGYQWVSGFWAPANTPSLEYVEDPPPETLEVGPSSPAPSEDDFWVPGNWVLSADDYRWRPGFWHPYQSNWTWVAARYVWTPRGCVYLPGYWDYPLTRRGCLFAPVHFVRPIYRQAGYRYRPSFWIGYRSFLLHLFIRPNWGHYYFGDYYAPIYRHRHYYACHSYFRQHRGFTPLYTYYQHHYRRTGIDYARRVHNWHVYYQSHPNRRPPHTWAAQHHRQRQFRGTGSAAYDTLAQAWYRLPKDRLGDWKLERANWDRQSSIHRHSDEIRSIAALRRSTERPAMKRPSGPGPVDGRPGRRTARLDLPETVIRNGGRHPSTDLTRRLSSGPRQDRDGGTRSRPRPPFASNDRDTSAARRSASTNSPPSRTPRSDVSRRSISSSDVLERLRSNRNTAGADRSSASSAPSSRVRTGRASTNPVDRSTGPSRSTVGRADRDQPRSPRPQLPTASNSRRAAGGENRTNVRRPTTPGISQPANRGGGREASRTNRSGSPTPSPGSRRSTELSRIRESLSGGRSTGSTNSDRDRSSAVTRPSPTPSPRVLRQPSTGRTTPSTNFSPRYGARSNNFPSPSARSRPGDRTGTARSSDNGSRRSSDAPNVTTRRPTSPSLPFSSRTGSRSQPSPPRRDTAVAPASRNQPTFGRSTRSTPGNRLTPSSPATRSTPSNRLTPGSRSALTTPSSRSAPSSRSRSASSSRGSSGRSSSAYRPPSASRSRPSSGSSIRRGSNAPSPRSAGRSGASGASRGRGSRGEGNGPGRGR